MEARLFFLLFLFLLFPFSILLPGFYLDIAAVYYYALSITIFIYDGHVWPCTSAIPPAVDVPAHNTSWLIERPRECRNIWCIHAQRHQTRAQCDVTAPFLYSSIVIPLRVSFFSFFTTLRLKRYSSAAHPIISLSKNRRIGCRSESIRDLLKRTRNSMHKNTTRSNSSNRRF